MKNKYNILLYDNGQPFDLETSYKEPLGGSETSFSLLAKGLSDLGHKIVLLTSKKINRIQQSKIIIDNNNYLLNYAKQSDIIIINRSIPRCIDELKDKILYYYAHDAYDQVLTHWMGIPKNLDYFQKILCVSNWQKNTFIEYFNIQDTNKLEVIGNSIDYSLSYGYGKREENKLVFAGIPYKAIEILSDLFNDICIRSKRDDLELHIYSDMSIYNQEEKNKEYEKEYSKLSKIKNVYLHKPVSLPELNYIFKTSNLYLSPNLYHETFGINLVMAQANGCIPISTNKGAISEVLYSQDLYTEEPNIENIDTYNKYVDLVIKHLDKDNYKLSLNTSKHTQQWDYLKIAQKVIGDQYNGK